MSSFPSRATRSPASRSRSPVVSGGCPVAPRCAQPAPDAVPIPARAARTQARRRSHVRTLAVLGHDDAFAFQFQIGTLDGDDAYLKIHGKLADGRDGLTFRPVTDEQSAA